MVKIVFNDEFDARRLKSEFALSIGAGNYLKFEGLGIDDSIDEWSDPDICIRVLKQFQAETPFSHICVIPKFPDDARTMLVCNMKPTAIALITSLDESEAGQLVIKIRGAPKGRVGQVVTHGFFTIVAAHFS